QDQERLASHRGYAVPCRSRLAGEKRETAAFIQAPRVIVNDHRRQAGSYSDLRLILPLLHTTQAGCQAAVLLLLILILGAPSNTLAGIRQGFGG
ncbi:hypothetical protein, partial [Pseudomonas reactans]|uniref:hypothetical protein n=1 Tax=Pseudomonas reactans TaxID=117680 RepID=UPI001C43229D